jgi:hypothetical protein
MSATFEQFTQAAAARSEELLGSARDATRRLERAIENLPADGDRRNSFRLLLNLAGGIVRDLELAEQHADTGRLICVFATGKPERTAMEKQLSRMLFDEANRVIKAAGTEASDPVQRARYDAGRRIS